MRAVQCTTVGSIDDLVIHEVDPPPLRAGSVRVKVRAAGLNFVDALFVTGEYQIKPTPPFIPGSEIAGVICEVGEGVVDRALGQRVMVSCGLGGFAEEVVVPASGATVIPDTLSLEAAATLTQSYCTALFSLRDRAKLQVGEQVLVLGAGGGVGYASVDIAHSLGAHVIAAASTEAKRAHARSAGADETIDAVSARLKDEARSASGGGVDVVVDVVGATLADPALRSLREFGRYLVIGFAGGTIPNLPANQILLRNRTVIGVDWGAWAMSHGPEQAALLHDVLSMFDAGSLHPPEPTTYRLDQVQAALHDLTERRVTGKAALLFD